MSTHIIANQNYKQKRRSTFPGRLHTNLVSHKPTRYSSKCTFCFWSNFQYGHMPTMIAKSYTNHQVTTKRQSHNASSNGAFKTQSIVGVKTSLNKSKNKVANPRWFQKTVYSDFFSLKSNYRFWIAWRRANCVYVCGIPNKQHRNYNKTSIVVPCLKNESANKKILFTLFVIIA